MGKRKHRTKDPEEIRKKIRRLERRLNRHAYSDSEDSYYESEYSYDSREMRSVVSVPSADEVNANVSVQDPVTEACEEENATLTADILEALGVSKEKIETFAPKIREEISERWGRIITDGLSRESVQKLQDSILFPENFKLLKAPQLNSEISTVLSESSKNRDKRLEKAQNHLGKGIAAITNLLSTLIDGDVQKSDIIKKLSETGQLLLDLHCQNTFSRRKLILFSLDKKFSEIIKGVKRDSYIFGENLGEKIKASKTAERSGIQIKRTFEPRPSTSTSRASSPARRQGNWRGPPRAQTQRGGRGGGPRNQAPSYTSRRPAATSDRYNRTSKRDVTSKAKTSHKN